MTETRMTLRLPEDLHEWFKEDSQRVHNSVNAHVVMALEEYRRIHGNTDIQRRLEQLETEVALLRGRS